ncbi:hypothetical protein EV426DRAFT_708538 [Tirmania nivea]|nr:hypothetical protein EV426DRAFT_708538 [Tirmania nivea]
MAPTIISSKLTLTYPLFCADFFEPPSDSDEPVTVAVAGGGGEGRSGVRNRITIIDVSSPTEAKTVSEVELSGQEDSPMSLCTLPGSGGSVVAGINSGAEVIKSTGGEGNLHFRVFRQQNGEEGEMKEVVRKAVFSAGVLREGDMYQRLCRGKSGVVVIGSGGGKKAENEMVVVKEGEKGWEKGWEVKGRVRPEEGKEVVDLDVDVDVELEGEGWTVGWCLPQAAYIANSKDVKPTKTTESPKAIFTLTPGSGAFRSLRFITHPSIWDTTPKTKLIAAIVNLPARGGAQLLTLSSPSIPAKSAVLARRNLHRNIKAATSMALVSLPPTTTSRGQPQAQSLLAVSGADMSVEILVLDYPLTPNVKEGEIKIRTLKTFYNVHPFQITKVAWSQPVRTATAGWELKLATVSMGQTVVTYTIPLVSVTTGLGIEGAEGAGQGVGSSTAELFVPSKPPSPSPEKRGKQRSIKKSGAASSSPSLSQINHQGMYVLPPPGTRRAAIYSVTVSLGLVVVLAILLQLIFIYKGGLLVAPVGVDALSQMGYPGEARDEYGGKEEEMIVDMVREGAEVVGEWVVEEGRKVAGGVVKGMVRGVVEQGVRGVLGG